MLLNEFFGKAIDVSKKIDGKKEGNNSLLNNLFYYIIDNDKLYKEYFLPIAKLMIKNEGMGKKCTEEFMPMVKRGCMEFYKSNKMKGEPKKLFPKEMRDELCEKLHDHYREGIVKKEYKVA